MRDDEREMIRESLAAGARSMRPGSTPLDFLALLAHSRGCSLLQALEGLASRARRRLTGSTSEATHDGGTP